MMEEALKRDEVDLVTRELALNDLFFLLVYVLGVDFANNDWVFDRCREVQAEPDGFLDIWSREHGSAGVGPGLVEVTVLGDRREDPGTVRFVVAAR